MVRAATLTIIAALLAGCDSPPKEPASPTTETPPNHWTVTPIGTSVVDGITYYTAWRLDTQTGELDFCIYDPGPEKPLVARDGRVISAGPNVNCGASDTPR